MPTDRQREVLDYVTGHHAEQGVFPTVREIQRHFGFASPFAVTRHLQALIKKGVLQRPAGRARSFIFPHAAHSPRASQAFHSPNAPNASRAPLARRVPLFGTIPAGSPVSAEAAADEFISLHPESLGLPPRAELFALRVRGDSMTGAGIREGDVVFLTPREPRSGEIVAALIDGESTLKRFVREKGRAVLRAENPRYPALHPVRELVVQGVMVGLLRAGSS